MKKFRFTKLVTLVFLLFFGVSFIAPNVQAQSQNYVRNGGFEEFSPWGIPYWVTMWNVRLETTNVHTGNYAMKVGPDSSWLLQDVSNIQAGRDYLFTVWIKPQQPDLFFDLVWVFDQYTIAPYTSFYLPAQDYYSTTSYNTSLFVWIYESSNNYYSYKFLLRAPADAKFLRIGFHAGCSICYFFVDDVSLVDADTEAPTTTIALEGTIGNNDWYTSDVQVSFTATDNPGGSGVAKTEYSFDNTSWNLYTGPFTINVEGITTIYYRSTDNAGNVEETKSQIIKIDKTPPSINIVSPEAKDYLSTQTIEVSFKREDSISGIFNVSSTLDGNPIANGEIINFKTLALGTHTFSVIAQDNAGNNATQSVNFNVVPVPFAFFSAKVEAEIGSEITDNKLETKGIFTLGQESDGIYPINEKVALSFFDVFFEIPTGSFKWFKHPKKPEKSEWKFEGIINNVPVEMKIKPLGNNSYEFKFEAEGLNLCWLKNSLKVKLNIGDDFGEVEVEPEVKGLENWENVCSGVPIPPGINTPGISSD